MNDSISLSSYSSTSANNSNSNSLNRSSVVIAAPNMNSSINTSGVSSASSSSTSSTGHVLFRNALRYASHTIDDYMPMPMTPVRRRAKSQTIYDGDEINTIAEHNKQLIEDIYLLKKQLKDKDDTILKLNDIRNNLESEIQELSASLFEQAYLMVNEARAETAQSEKLLKEANGKIDVLQAEVKALKELVLTSTPSTPNKHLHPQLSTSTANSSTTHAKSSTHSRNSSLNQQSLNNLVQNLNGSNSNLAHSGVAAQTLSIQVPSHSSKILQTPSSSSLNYKENNSNKMLAHSSSSLQPLSMFSSSKSSSHKRNPSHNDIMTKPVSFIDKLFQSSSSASSIKSKQHQEELNVSNITANRPPSPIDLPEFDPIYFKEIVEWKETPELMLKGSFMTRVYEEDILPCLHFNDRQVSGDLLNAIEGNTVCIEELTNSQQCAEALVQVCGLSNISSFCQYKIKLAETSPWIYISKLTRNRVISVCDFFSYLRYIKDGLVKSDIHEIYWTIIDLRKKISLSRLGL